MGDLLGQDLATGLNNVQVKIVEKPIAREYKKKSILLFVVLFAYLLIPVLSIEGIVGWFLGISGAYKTINLYRNEEDNKNRKSIKLLVIYIIIAVIYNVLVYYAQNYEVAKTV